MERRKEFKEFLGLLRGKRVLDLGCGSGDHALWFKEHGLDVMGIDISEEMITLTKNKGVDAEIMDIESLGFGENSFDGIWAVTSLLHVPKSRIENVVDSLSFILDSGGILFVAVKEGEGERFIVDKQNSDTKRFFSFWKEEELIESFKRKFEIIESWKQEVGSSVFLHFFFRNRKSA